MSKAKHYPGPYVVEVQDGVFSIAATDPDYQGERVPIAEIDGDFEDNEEENEAICFATAKILAAAPDMLEALAEAEALIARTAYPSPCKPDSPWGVLRRIRAAIKKATGEGRS